MIYRRRLWSQVWHWRLDCRYWPRRLFKEQKWARRPAVNLCDHCADLEVRERLAQEN